VLFVTSVAPRLTAWAAIRVSIAPIGSRIFRGKRGRRRTPWRSPRRNRTLRGEEETLEAAPFPSRAPALRDAVPQFASVIEEIPTSPGGTAETGQDPSGFPRIISMQDVRIEKELHRGNRSRFCAGGCPRSREKSSENFDRLAARGPTTPGRDQEDDVSRFLDVDVILLKTELLRHLTA